MITAHRGRVLVRSQNIPFRLTELVVSVRKYFCHAGAGLIILYRASVWCYGAWQMAKKVPAQTYKMYGNAAPGGDASLACLGDDSRSFCRRLCLHRKKSQKYFENAHTYRGHVAGFGNPPAPSIWLLWLLLAGILSNYAIDLSSVSRGLSQSLLAFPIQRPKLRLLLKPRAKK
jgi:hypothetical protein